MRSPHEQILDMVVKMDARGARKVRDMADAHLRDLDPEGMTPDGPTPWQQATTPLWRPCEWCGKVYSPTCAVCNATTKGEGAELQRGLEEAVIRERERLDGPDDDSEEPGGQA